MLWNPSERRICGQLGLDGQLQCVGIHPTQPASASSTINSPDARRFWFQAKLAKSCTRRLQSLPVVAKDACFGRILRHAEKSVGSIHGNMGGTQWKSWSSSESASCCAAGHLPPASARGRGRGSTRAYTKPNATGRNGSEGTENPGSTCMNPACRHERQV